MKNLFSVLFLVVVILPLNNGCNPPQSPLAKPNIVWITSEDNSKHYMNLFDENGVSTPNIALLANHGLTYTHAFSNAPVCSVARSTIISGSYGPRIGSQYHRRMAKVPMPQGLKMFPAYLRQAGYYTTNNSKEDYNIVKSDDVWDESSKRASWKNREGSQPFFHVFNIHNTHESSLHFTKEEMQSVIPKTDEQSFKVQPNHPNTKLFRYANALYRDKIKQMDSLVGNVINELKQEGLLENTFVFYFGDHGGILPGSKGYLYETGLHVPMVAHVPNQYKHLIDAELGVKIDGFVSFVDLAPTMLNLADVSIPDGMDGRPFLGKNVRSEEVNARDQTFGYADRFDEKYDLVRSLRKGKYKYIRNYQPFNFDGLMNNYRYKQLTYQEWDSLYIAGNLNKIQSAFFEDRLPEMLFDVEADPYETINLIADPEVEPVLKVMRESLNNQLLQMPDLSFFPEHYFLDKGIENPVEFGRQHQHQIQNYIEIANLGLNEFDKVASILSTKLSSEDPWERYWALVTCCVFKDRALSLETKIQSIACSDEESLNRVRATEYLGMTNRKFPAEVITEALYGARKPAEALMILNSIVLLQSAKYNYKFDIQIENVSDEFLKNIDIKNRLTYLKVL